MLDDLNGDDESDRLKLEWELTSPRTARCCAGEPLDALHQTAPAVLSQDSSGRPVVTSSDAPEVLVRVPADIETLRRRDPDPSWPDTVWSSVAIPAMPSMSTEM
jgi:predicted GNAT superfamily acetyltransferase